MLAGHETYIVWICHLENGVCFAVSKMKRKTNRLVDDVIDDGIRGGAESMDADTDAHRRGRTRPLVQAESRYRVGRWLLKRHLKGRKQGRAFVACIECEKAGADGLGCHTRSQHVIRQRRLDDTGAGDESVVAGSGRG